MTRFISAIESSVSSRRGVIIFSLFAIASFSPFSAWKGANCLARFDLGIGAHTVFFAILQPPDKL
jgi:hypothetical protein